MVTTVGKKFEQYIFAELKTLQQKKPIYYHRLTDSHSSGKFVSPQPCDLLLATAGIGTLYIELKTSEVFSSLMDSPRQAFRPTQLGKFKLLSRAGQTVMCIFYSTVTERIEVWDITMSIDILADNKLKKDSIIARFPPENFAKFIDTLL